MSVSIQRFVRVMSGGTVVTDQLVAVRHAKAQQGLAAVQAQLNRLTQAGITPRADFMAQFQTLQQQLTAAMQQPNNQAKCDALEPLKEAFRTIIAQSTQRVDAVLADVTSMRQKDQVARSAIDNADLMTQHVTNPAFSAPLAARLATVRNNRPDITTATSSTLVQAMIQGLDACTADANAIATEAVRTVQFLAQHTAKVTEINTALSALSAVTAQITEPQQRNEADTALNGLTQRRDALANVGPAGIAQEMRTAPALLAEIKTATTTANQRLAWSNTLARRDVIRRDAADYEAVGKKKGNGALESGAAKLAADLAKLETLSRANPKAAGDGLPKLEGDHNALKTQFGRIVSDAKLVQRVADLVISDPTGPEAEMQKALGTDNNGVDVFEARLLEVYNNNKFKTSPEYAMVTPGEAVAIYTYTTNDYKQMNGFLYGKNPLDPPDDPVLGLDLKPPTEDQIKAKNKQAADAMAKLPPWTGGTTKRGDRGFVGDDAMFADQATFAIKAFWSTDKKRAFPGKWQMFIDGDSGRNVAMMSAYPNEDEVLYPPGTKFKVLSRDETNLPTIVLVLKEVP